MSDASPVGSDREGVGNQLGQTQLLFTKPNVTARMLKGAVCGPEVSGQRC